MIDYKRIVVYLPPAKEADLIAHCKRFVIDMYWNYPLSSPSNSQKLYGPFQQFR